MSADAMLPTEAGAVLERRRTGHRFRSLLTALLMLVSLAGCSATASASSSSASTNSSSGASARRSAGKPPDSLAVSAMNGFSAAQLPQPQLDRQLEAMQANGVRVVRADAPWARIQPLPPGPTGPGWQFSQTDAWVSALATHHLTWQPLIDFSVWWAKTCPGFCAPTSDATYATFARAVAARYGANGSFWNEHPQLPYYPAQIFEIWNEENTSLFWVTPTRYAHLYAAAREAIRSADPGASVIVGGLADDSRTFNASQDYPAWYVRQMFAADPGLKRNVDGFGLHPYGATPADDLQWTVHFRHALDALGEASAPIDVTELGWPAGDATGEAGRAWMMNAVALDLSRSNCGIRLLAPYDWINPTSLHEAGDFGFVDRSGLKTILRPAGTGWFSGLKRAASLPQLRLCDRRAAPRGEASSARR